MNINMGSPTGIPYCEIFLPSSKFDIFLLANGRLQVNPTTSISNAICNESTSQKNSKRSHPYSRRKLCFHSVDVAQTSCNNRSNTLLLQPISICCAMLSNSWNGRRDFYARICVLAIAHRAREMACTAVSMSKEPTENWGNVFFCNRLWHNFCFVLFCVALLPLYPFIQAVRPQCISISVISTVHSLSIRQYLFIDSL